MPDLKKMLTLEALSEALPSWLKRSTKPEYNADEIDSTLTTNQFVSASDKDNWNAKGTYSKPSGGIPKSDLSSIVQTSLEKADSALQSETDPTVPSWAKQSSKPSYTQDEVPDGSTYKRVNQTEKDTWSGKQNALTTTQMQAVNSGITAAKVSNISYAINTGVKNILNLTSLDVSWAKFNADKSVTVDYTASSSTVYVHLGFDGNSANAWSRTPEDWIGKTFSGIPDNMPSNTLMGIEFSNNGSSWSYEISLTSSRSSVTIPDYPYCRIFIKINGGGSSWTLTFKPMICKSELYVADSSYQPYALSNSVLTPALIDQVDGGAKNLIDCSVDNIKSLNSSSMYSWNGNTVTAYGRTATVNADKTITVAAGTGSAEFWLKVANYTYASGVSYVLSGCPTNGSTTTYYTESDNLNLRDIGSGVVINSATTDALYIVVKTTGSTPALTFKPMLCTLADWNVSQKFVPYRLDYDTLAEYATHNSYKIENPTTNADLNSISSSGFKFYDNPTNGPSDGTGRYLFVRTTIYDSNAAMQECFSLLGKAYFRAKSGGTWTEWKLMTNV